MRQAAVLLLALLAAVACRDKGALGGDAGTSVTSDAAVEHDAAALGDAGDTEDDADADAAASELSVFTPRHVETGLCNAIGRPNGMYAQFVSRRDLTTSFVDGDDLLALANRSPLGTLPPDYAPTDMVELHGGTPASARECETRYGACLRAPAADALKKMLAEMKTRGFQGRIESAYRSYAAQCGTFVNWIKKDKDNTFCSVSEQSALAGHSQHQLGTTVDLFTEEWFLEGEKKHLGSFRDGFGCTAAGKWIAETSWQFGFVLPYPIHPDDRHESQPCLARWDQRVPANPRTGYRNEPWHVRFVGVENAARFHEAWVASTPGSPGELTLEQWLRKRNGLAGDADLPVCDGCACSACATLAPGVDATSNEARDGGAPRPEPCKDESLFLDDRGAPVAPSEEPSMVDARIGAARKDAGTVIEVKISAPAHTITQPPVAGDSGPIFVAGSTFESLVPYARTGAHGYADLPGAWRVAIEANDANADVSARWPWRASLAKESLARTYNRANLYLAARPGETWVRIVVVLPPGASSIRVTLLKDGAEHGTRELRVR